MLGFLARRGLSALVTLLAASIVIYLATNLLPGNVATTILGKNATPASLHLLESRLHLNESLVHRYVSWLGGVLHGNLGQSAVAVAEDAPTKSVSALIGVPLRNSAILAAITMVILFPLALALGAAAGIRAGRRADYLISYSTLVTGANPEFVLATFLVAIFFTQLHVLPPLALVAPGETPFTHPDALVLPVFTLLGVALGASVRQIRAGVIEIMRQDYVTVARLNGLGGRLLLWRYVLRNALVPSVQVFAQTAQYLVGGLVVVEAVFAYPGIGNFLVAAIGKRDLPEVAAIAVILAAIYIAINIFADLVVIFLVPRLRTGLQR